MYEKTVINDSLLLNCFACAYLKGVGPSQCIRKKAMCASFSVLFVLLFTTISHFFTVSILAYSLSFPPPKFFPHVSHVSSFACVNLNIATTNACSKYGCRILDELSFKPKAYMPWINPETSILI